MSPVVGDCVLDGLVSAGLLGSVRLLPAAIHIPALTALVVGVVLWLLGGRVLKPAFAIIGTAAGALLGALALPSVMPEKVWTLPSPYAGMAIGAVVGLALATAAFRFALAVAGAASLAAAGALAAGVYLAATDRLPADLFEARRSLVQDADSSELREELDRAGELVKDAGKRLVKGESLRSVSTDNDSLRESGAAAAVRVRTVAQEFRASAATAWGGVSERDRLLVFGVGFVSGLAGLLLGAFAPTSTAGLITAMLGAGVVLASGLWTLRAADIELWGATDRLAGMGPMGFGITWAVMAIAGLLAQRKLRSKKDKPQPKAEPSAA